jgi:hypothetical protein
MQMHMRRFTRLTNAFSKKVENHAAAVSLHAMYNFVRIHQTLKVTPAMAAGLLALILRALQRAYLLRRVQVLRGSRSRFPNTSQCHYP